jgi:hypothetical protein
LRKQPFQGIGSHWLVCSPGPSPSVYYVSFSPLQCQIPKDCKLNNR